MTNVSQFKVTLENSKGEVIKENSFKGRAYAKKHVKEEMKKNNLIRHAGHIVNYSEGLELFTNF